MKAFKIFLLKTLIASALSVCACGILMLATNLYSGFVSRLPEIKLSYDENNLTIEQKVEKDKITSCRTAVRCKEEESGKEFFYFRDTGSPRKEKFVTNWRFDDSEPKSLNVELPDWIYEEDKFSAKDEKKMILETKISVGNFFIRINKYGDYLELKNSYLGERNYYVWISLLVLLTVCSLIGIFPTKEPSQWPGFVFMYSCLHIMVMTSMSVAHNIIPMLLLFLMWATFFISRSVAKNIG